MGNEVKTENQADIQVPEANINSNPPVEETDIIQQPEIIAEEQINDNQNEVFNRLIEVKTVKTEKKSPLEKIESSNVFDDIKITETKFLPNASIQQEQHLEENKDVQKSGLNQEPIQENSASMNEQINMNTNINANVDNSDKSKITNLDKYIVNEPEIEQPDLTNKNKEDNKQNDGTFGFQSWNTNDINKIYSGFNPSASDSNIGNQNNNQNNSQDKNQNNQVEQPYNYSSLNLNENNINNENFNSNSNQAENYQSGVAYSDNNLNINPNQNSFKEKEATYTYDASIYNQIKNPKEENYIYGANIFLKSEPETNNLNINEHNYNPNNNIVDNINILDAKTYITTIDEGENINNFNNIQSQTGENLPATIYEDQNLNTDNVGVVTSNEVNPIINNNIIPQPKPENDGIHFSERQDIYNEKNDQTNEEAQKPKESIDLINNPTFQTNINVSINEKNNIENNIHESNQNQNNIHESNQNQNNIHESNQNQNNIDGNNNNENNINNKIDINLVKTGVFDSLRETKTLVLNINNTDAIVKDNEQGKKIEAVPEVQNGDGEGEEQGNEFENFIKNNFSGKEPEIEKDKKIKEDTKLDISNQIIEINEMPKNPMEQRDYIFNRKNIKVIKIEDEETHFCSSLLTPLFNKLFK